MYHPPEFILRSHKRRAAEMKYYVPMLLIAFSIGMLYDGFSTRRLLVICPALVAAFFFLSLANLDAADGVLRYRRFLKWVAIEPSEVRGSGVAWPGMVGYVRLHRYVVPWKKLYFVLDQRPWGANSRLLDYLGNKKRSQDDRQAFPPPAWSSHLGLYLAAGIGILACLTAFYLTPASYLQDRFSKPTTDMPTLLKTLFQLAGWFHTLVAEITGAAAMALLVLSRRGKPEAWLYAFLSGFGVAAIVVRLFS